MREFKVGDKVRLIDKYPYAGLITGEIGIVTSLEGLCFSVNRKTGCTNPHWELVEAANELEELVKKVNDGSSAYDLILNKYRKEVEYVPFSKKIYRDLNDKDDVEFQDIRIKQKTFEPFYVGAKECCSYDPKTGQGSGHTGPCRGKWEVRLEGDTVSVGCQKFEALNLYYGLKALNEGCSTYEHTTFTLKATKNGVWHEKGQISWKDSEKIVAALEKAGF